MNYIVKHKWLYYTIQFTWGLFMNIIGLCVFGYLRVVKKIKPKKFHNCWYMPVGNNWGGLELGTFFLVDKSESMSTKYHEAGHGIQNIIWGPLFFFIIFVPSGIRYWYRKIRTKLGLKNKTDYDSIWFEGQATKWGRKYYAE